MTDPVGDGGFLRFFPPAGSLRLGDDDLGESASFSNGDTTRTASESERGSCASNGVEAGEMC